MLKHNLMLIHNNEVINKVSTLIARSVPRQNNRSLSASISEHLRRGRIDSDTTDVGVCAANMTSQIGRSHLRTLSQYHLACYSISFKGQHESAVATGFQQATSLDFPILLIKH